MATVRRAHALIGAHQKRTIDLDELTLTVLDAHRRRMEDLASGFGLDVLPHGYLFSRSSVGAEPPVRIST